MFKSVYHRMLNELGFKDIIALIIVLAYVTAVFMRIEVSEQFVTAFVFIMGYYFGVTWTTVRNGQART